MNAVEMLAILAYVGFMVTMGYMGWRGTRTSTDYLLAGRKAHPVVMALSYGAAFISTSAIVGFGGVAAMYGMGLMWLVFLNIFVGIFVAFVIIGEPTRRMGRHLNAHTFPEFLGKRYQSSSLQVFVGIVILLFMPMYATAVLLGGAEFIHAFFHLSNFSMTLFVLAVVVGIYVLTGGLKGVMYNDAIQASIMIGGMALLLLLTYAKLGGVTTAHQELSAMAGLVPQSLQDVGHRGWTRFPALGWGAQTYNLGWTVVTTIILGVGIGVLTQPQMAVRFMTVRSKRELNRAVAVGALFILIIPGAAYTTGALSNVYFHNHEVIHGTLLARDTDKNTLTLQPDTSRPGDPPITLALGPDSVVEEMGGGQVAVQPKLTAAQRSGGNVDKIMPYYISSALPRWFGLVFLLVLVSAAVSTLSSQFHTIGTAVGRDILVHVLPAHLVSDRATLVVSRVGVLYGLAASVLCAHYLRGYIAIATAIFFGLCAASFFPAYLGGLFWRRMTKAGAVASAVGGFLTSLLWMVFVYRKTATALGVCKALTGGDVLFASPNWPVVDPLLIGLPVSLLLAVVVSLATRPPDRALVEGCFR